ncbi:MAG: hypothetical protein R2815_12270 [Flavobacteriales bacterium]|nr:hypothetical protein [Flavobacteriales bacterium]
MSTTNHPVALICTFTWVGFMCGISFLEAWLKFRAPGVTLPIGLGIGRLVFGALNKVEMVLAAAILIDLIRGGSLAVRWPWIAVPVVLLLLQSFWLLPALDTRAELIIQGTEAPPSNLHFVFVLFELVKVGALVVFGIKLFGR